VKHWGLGAAGHLRVGDCGDVPGRVVAVAGDVRGLGQRLHAGGRGSQALGVRLVDVGQHGLGAIDADLTILE
jgi:hypothetical protein